MPSFRFLLPFPEEVEEVAVLRPLLVPARSVGRFLRDRRRKSTETAGREENTDRSLIKAYFGAAWRYPLPIVDCTGALTESSARSCLCTHLADSALCQITK